MCSISVILQLKERVIIKFSYKFDESSQKHLCKMATMSNGWTMARGWFLRISKAWSVKDIINQYVSTKIRLQSFFPILSARHIFCISTCAFKCQIVKPFLLKRRRLVLNCLPHSKIMPWKESSFTFNRTLPNVTKRWRTSWRTAQTLQIKNLRYILEKI